MTSATDPAARAHALAVLGLPDTATAAQIVDAYRRMVRATHPDATGRTDPDAGHGFTAVHDAYQLLTQQPGDDPPPSAEPHHERGEERSTFTQRPPRRPLRGSSRPFGSPTAPPIVAGPAVVTRQPGNAHRTTGAADDH